MKLPEIEALDLETAEAHLDFLLQIFRTAQRLPCVRAATREAGLGGDDETLRVGVEGFRDDFFADVGPVGVGGVDEIDAEFNPALEDALRLRAVFGFAPDAVTCKAHGAESEAVNRSFAAEGEGAAGLCRECGCGAHAGFLIVTSMRRVSRRCSGSSRVTALRRGGGRGALCS